MTPSPPPSGLRGFVIVWIGQVISLLGTAMSSFGLTIWVYKLTGSATALSLMSFFFVTPMLIYHLFWVGDGAGRPVRLSGPRHPRGRIDPPGSR